MSENASQFNGAAAALGRRGGRKGGRARARSLSAAQRRDSASHAAHMRWHKAETSLDYDIDWEIKKIDDEILRLQAQRATLLKIKAEFVRGMTPPPPQEG